MSNISERQTSEWDVRAAPGNYAALVLTQGGSALASFASIWILTRILGPGGYGGIMAILAASWVAQVLINWTALAVVRFGVDEFVERGIIATIFWLRLSILAINVAIVLALAWLWLPPLARWLKLGPETYPFVLLHFVVTASWIHVQYGLQGAKLPRVQGVLLMAERIVIVAALIALALAKRLDIRAAILCYIAAAVIMTAAGVYRLRRLIFHRWTLHWPFVRTVTSFSLPLLPFSLVGYFSGSYVDAAFVTKFLSTRDLGFYSVGTQISGMAMQLPTLANSLLLPLFVTLQKEEQEQRLQRVLRDLLPSLTLLWGVGATMAAFAGTFAIPLIFGRQFAASIEPLWILLAASTLTLPVLTGYSSLSNATSRTSIPMVATALAAAANIALNMLLIPRWGMAGCAWATMIAYFVSLFTFAAYLRTASDVSLLRVATAIAPPILGAASFSLHGNAALSLAVCVAVAMIVAFFESDALKRTVLVIRNVQAKREASAC